MYLSEAPDDEIIEPIRRDIIEGEIKQLSALID